MRRRLGVVVAAAATLVTAGVASSPATPVAATTPPERRVAFFTDSVGLGARSVMPEVFGPEWSVHVDGQPARFVEQMESQYVRPRLATNPEWFGDHVVLGVAYNAPYWDWPRLDRSIDSIIATLTEAGVKYVHWVTLRDVTYANTPPGGRRQIELYGFYFPTVNERLEAALERHPNLSLVDWRAVSDRLGLTYDAIHLNPAGAELYSTIVRDSVVAVATRIDDGGTATIEVPGADGAGAAIVNLTVTDPRTVGFLSAGAAGCEQAGVSVHNYWRAAVAAHSAIVPLTGAGALCVGTRAAVNLIADVSGTFPADGGFVALTPKRWADTRAVGARVAPGATLRLDLADLDLPGGVPASDVAGLALTVTAVGADQPGFLQVLPCGTSGDTSNVNYLNGFPVPNLVVATPAADGTVCVTSSAATDVLVDAFGLFDTTAGLTPAAERVFDSRATGAPVAAGSVTRIDLAELVTPPTPTTTTTTTTTSTTVAETTPPTEGPGEGDGDDEYEQRVNGVVLNLTAVNAQAPGFVTAYPCAAGTPTASNLNVVDGQAVSNAAIVAPDADGAICVYSHSATDLIVDIQATIGQAFEGRTPERLLDTRAR